MHRYLLNVSYIGTNFRGVQKLVSCKKSFQFDPDTIQGQLEIGLNRLKSVGNPQVVTSSRTDAGVHALHSTFHVDLQKPNNEPYGTDEITRKLNKYFHRESIQIRILKTNLVPNNFHCRHNVKSRTYLYRLAVLKEQFFDKNDIHLYHIPIEENGRCHFICVPNFDMEKVKSAINLFLGIHDFRTFMGKGRHFLDKNTIRTLHLDLSNGISSVALEPSFTQNSESKYDYWNVVINSSGFLYNQVRRIVGTLIAVGQDKVSETEIQCMLQVPSHLSWNPRIIPAPSYGLYLCKVEYCNGDLKTFS